MWSRELLKDLLGMNVQPVKRDSPVHKTLDDKIEYILRTHNRAFHDWLKDKSDAEIATFLRERTATKNPTE
jgi:hypothetical protein